MSHGAEVASAAAGLPAVVKSLTGKDISEVMAQSGLGAARP